MIFEPIPLSQFLNDHGIFAEPVISEEPELEPHTIELEAGLSIIFRDEFLCLQQEKSENFIDIDEFRNINALVDAIKEILEDRE